eukprot:NODE_5509_length_645_cov_11.911197_g5345_i0.p1 GENE.NODE_5509_length_645_cov_11.911197_g5345_i0~~NODE_5509_length_645_cov_11.911197_g5345_i0.p1  ORF type:complete len:176 (+),score=45.88 NODE_5509_length_645_cov_11.911197_g5345_i0:69-596(+)
MTLITPQSCLTKRSADETLHLPSKRHKHFAASPVLPPLEVPLVRSRKRSGDSSPLPKRAKREAPLEEDIIPMDTLQSIDLEPSTRPSVGKLIVRPKAPLHLIWEYFQTYTATYTNLFASPRMHVFSPYPDLSHTHRWPLLLDAPKTDTGVAAEGEEGDLVLDDAFQVYDEDMELA